MSIGPDIETWKRRFSACLLAVLGALLLTGAREVTLELRRHDARLEKVQTELADWSRQLAGNPQPAAGHAPVGQQALFVVRMCSLPSRQP